MSDTDESDYPESDYPPIFASDDNGMRGATEDDMENDDWGF
ncbi:hypothetical protein ACFYPN_16040 [Streptomyces sp. NPDC005576]